MSHPNLSDELNRQIAKSNAEGGVYLADPKFGPTIDPARILAVGRALLVQTEEATYTIRKKTEKDFTIQGHPKCCPEETKVYIDGSTFGGSVTMIWFVGRGMHLKFQVGDGPGWWVTGEIQEITEVAP